MIGEQNHVLDAEIEEYLRTAATHRTMKAREWLAGIRAEDGPADVINLVEEIARRHQLTDEAPQQLPGWIEETERAILLAEFA